MQGLFTAQALMFTGAFFGSQGLRIGALWMFPFGWALCWAANKTGRNYTRNVCRQADKSIEEKQRTFSNANLMLWVLIPVTALVAVVLAAWFR